MATTPAAPFAQGSAPSQGSQIAFKAGVDVVSVNVSVRDSRGGVVRDLKKADFEVIDSGVRREIRDFQFGDSPVSLAVLLDISGSMSVGGNMDRAREAVAVAMANLRSRSDEAALFTFDSELQEVVRFTTELDRVRRVSLDGQPWGQTSLYDAVAQTARTVAARTNRDRQRDRRAGLSADGRESGGSPGRRVRRAPDGRPRVGHRDACGPGALDGRRHAHRESACAHDGGDRRSVRRAPSPISHHLRAGGTRRMAPARDSHAEEEPDRSRAKRVHGGPLAELATSD